MLFKDFSDKWVDNYKCAKAKNTQRLYKNIIATHINPNIGKLDFSEIKKSDLQDIINKTLDKPSTCRHIKLTLNQIFTDAYDEGIINKNLCKSIVIPKNFVSEKRVLYDIEKENLLKIDFDPMEKMFICLIYGCGLRKGEALALNKSDFQDRKVHINKSIAFDFGKPYLTTTKSLSGVREVPMPQFAMDCLDNYGPKESLFNIGGEYLTDAQYTTMWKNIVRKIDKTTKCSKDLTAHIFRHNYATMLYYSNISIKMAARLLGHSNINTTINIYSHLDDEKENTIQKINEMF